jgi:hypothetical protein
MQDVKQQIEKRDRVRTKVDIAIVKRLGRAGARPDGGVTAALDAITCVSTTPTGACTALAGAHPPSRGRVLRSPPGRGAHRSHVKRCMKPGRLHPYVFLGLAVCGFTVDRKVTQVCNQYGRMLGLGDQLMFRPAEIA